MADSTAGQPVNEAERLDGKKQRRDVEERPVQRIRAARPERGLTPPASHRDNHRRIGAEQQKRCPSHAVAVPEAGLGAGQKPAASRLGRKRRGEQVNDERQVIARTRRTADTVEITISDSGPGILPEHVPKIFEAFFTTKKTGIGLGLALVQKIVVTHNGRVAAFNAPHGGARIAVTLPVAAD